MSPTHCLTGSSPSFLSPSSILLSNQSISQICLTIYHLYQIIFLLLTAVFFSFRLCSIKSFSGRLKHRAESESLLFHTSCLSTFLLLSILKTFLLNPLKKIINEDVLFWETFCCLKQLHLFVVCDIGLSFLKLQFFFLEIQPQFQYKAFLAIQCIYIL